MKRYLWSLFKLPIENKIFRSNQNYPDVHWLLGQESYPVNLSLTWLTGANTHINRGTQNLVIYLRNNNLGHMLRVVSTIWYRSWFIVDLFEKLVPLAIHSALAGYEAKKSALVNQEVGRLRNATQTMNGWGASLNPCRLLAVSDTGGVEPELPSSFWSAVGLRYLNNFSDVRS